MESILNIATKVRSECVKDVDNIMFHCTDFSRILKDALIEEGYNNVKVIKGNFKLDESRYSAESGKKYKWVDHAWVEVNGEILDITSDQFNDYLWDT